MACQLVQTTKDESRLYLLPNFIKLLRIFRFSLTLFIQFSWFQIRESCNVGTSSFFYLFFLFLLTNVASEICNMRSDDLYGSHLGLFQEAKNRLTGNWETKGERTRPKEYDGKLSPMLKHTWIVMALCTWATRSSRNDYIMYHTNVVGLF